MPSFSVLDNPKTKKICPAFRNQEYHCAENWVGRPVAFPKRCYFATVIVNFVQRVSIPNNWAESEDEDLKQLFLSTNIPHFPTSPPKVMAEF